MSGHVFDNEKHFIKCNDCGEVFDGRDLSQVFAHEHNLVLPILEHHYFGTPKKGDMTARCASCNNFLFTDEKKQPFMPHQKCECGGVIEPMVGTGCLVGKHPCYPDLKTFIDEDGINYFYAYKDRKGDFYVYHDNKMVQVKNPIIKPKL